MKIYKVTIVTSNNNEYITIEEMKEHGPALFEFSESENGYKLVNYFVSKECAHPYLARRYT